MAGGGRHEQLEASPPDSTTRADSRRPPRGEAAREALGAGEGAASHPGQDGADEQATEPVKTTIPIHEANRRAGVQLAGARIALSAVSGSPESDLVEVPSRRDALDLYHAVLSSLSQASIGRVVGAELGFAIELAGGRSVVFQWPEMEPLDVDSGPGLFELHVAREWGAARTWGGS